MQFLLNYEQYKDLINCGVCLLPNELYKFVFSDIATRPFIEDYAKKNRGGSVSLFDPRYPQIYRFKYQNNFCGGAIDYAEWQKDKKEALDKLVGNTSTAELKVANLIGELEITDYKQKKWLYAHASTEAQKIIDFLNDNRVNGFATAEAKSFGKAASEAFANGPTEEKNATLMALKISNMDLLKGPYDSNYFNTINQYIDADLMNPALQAIWAAHFTAQCAILKFQNPTWSNIRVYWEASKEMIHIALDLGGMVPVIGEICDITNGVIYTIQGDGVNAALSYSAAIPFVGWFSTGAKYAYKTVVFANGAKGTYKWIVKSSGLISFGKRNSARFRKAIGLVSGDVRQAHHLISRAKNIVNHNVVQKAARHFPPFHIDEALNGIAVTAWRNQPNHNLYNQRIFNRLEVINNSSLSPKQAYDALSAFMTELRGLIQNNPNVHLNDLIF